MLRFLSSLRNNLSRHILLILRMFTSQQFPISKKEKYFDYYFRMAFRCSLNIVVSHYILSIILKKNERLFSTNLLIWPSNNFMLVSSFFTFCSLTINKRKLEKKSSIGEIIWPELICIINKEAVYAPKCIKLRALCIFQLLCKDAWNKWWWEKVCYTIFLSDLHFWSLYDYVTLNP